VSEKRGEVALAGTPVNVTVNEVRVAPEEALRVIVATPAVPSLQTVTDSTVDDANVALLLAWNVAVFDLVVEIPETNPGPATVAVIVSETAVPLAVFFVAVEVAVRVSPSAFLTVTRAYATATGVAAVPALTTTAESDDGLNNERFDSAVWISLDTYSEPMEAALVEVAAVTVTAQVAVAVVTVATPEF